MPSTNSSGLFQRLARPAHSAISLELVLRPRISFHTSKFPGMCGWPVGSNSSRVDQKQEAWIRPEDRPRGAGRGSFSSQRS